MLYFFKHIVPKVGRSEEVIGITDYEILMTERYGSRADNERDAEFCEECEAKIDFVDDEPGRDKMGRMFCSAECFLKFYGWKKVD